MASGNWSLPIRNVVVVEEGKLFYLYADIPADLQAIVCVSQLLFNLTDGNVVTGQSSGQGDKLGRRRYTIV